MKLLALDTALGACSVAVLDGAHVLAHLFEPMERGHAERLAPMVQEAMLAADLAFEALDRLAVTVGPGTFTGQRVGYAFARGLRLALERPLVGVTTLDAMARAALEETGARGALVLHDARRGEVYASATLDSATIMPARLATADEAIEEIRSRFESLSGPLACAGTAAALAAQKWRELGRDAIETAIRSPDALWVGRLALDEPEPTTVPRPLYLRPPDARLPAAGS